MKRSSVFALAFFISSSLPAISDDRIYETKNICGRYYASEINSRESALLLGLSDSGRVSSRVEQYCNFFR
tara:strand:- start:665 stop:874 length:210 start_codon:yes stop_codon:yes gene_type:complete